jgi:hypothetical protein
VINEGQLAIQWFHGTGWHYVHGTVIAPEGVGTDWVDFRAVALVRCFDVAPNLENKSFF